MLTWGCDVKIDAMNSCSSCKILLFELFIISEFCFSFSFFFVFIDLMWLKFIEEWVSVWWEYGCAITLPDNPLEAVLIELFHWCLPFRVGESRDTFSFRILRRADEATPPQDRSFLRRPLTGILCPIGGLPSTGWVGLVGELARPQTMLISLCLAWAWLKTLIKSYHFLDNDDLEANIKRLLSSGREEFVIDFELSFRFMDVSVW